MRFGIDVTQACAFFPCFPDSVRVEAISLIACPLFYLIKVNILTKGITVLTSAIYENS